MKNYFRCVKKAFPISAIVPKFPRRLTLPCRDETNRFKQTFCTLQATDDDGKGQTSTVPLKVFLTDSNDNPPVFSQSIYRAFVNEGSVKFDPELFVEAVDADKTSHITYSIISGNDEDLFGIDKESGKIKIINTKGLDVKNDTDNVISLEVLVSLPINSYYNLKIIYSQFPFIIFFILGYRRKIYCNGNC